MVDEDNIYFPMSCMDREIIREFARGQEFFRGSALQIFRKHLMNEEEWKSDEMQFMREVANDRPDWERLKELKEKLASKKMLEP